MSQQIKINSPQTLFIIKTAACFAALLVGFFVLSQTASMQDDDDMPPPMSNSGMMSNGSGMMGNYKPMPEPPKSTVRGRVIYSDTGRAVRRAGLMLFSTKGAGGRETGGVTDERGEFEIKDVVEGSYFVSVSMPGVLTPLSSLTGVDQMQGNNAAAMAEIAKDFQAIVVVGGTDTDATVVVRRGAAITGRIMYADGDAAIGVRVEVLRKKDGQYGGVMPGLSEIFGTMFGGAGAAGGMKTDDRGVFRIAGLPAGEYVVRAVENVRHTEKSSGRGEDEFMAMLGFNPSSMVSTYYPNTTDLTKAESIKLELGQEQAEVNITISDRPLRDLGGVVVDKATRKPLRGARISVKNDDDVAPMFVAFGEAGARSESNEQGRWSYRQLPAGKYTLTVEPPYETDYYGSSMSGGSMSNGINSPKAKTPKLARLQREIVVGDEDQTDLILELGYGASVSGTIGFDTNEAFAQPISVTAAEENGKSTESDAVGFEYFGGAEDDKPVAKKSLEFNIGGISAGRYFLHAVGFGTGGLPGGESGKTEQPFYVKSVLINGTDISRAALEIKEGEQIKGVRIILSRAVGKLRGTVLKADKSPAAGAKMFVVPTDSARRENFQTYTFAATDDAGEFEVTAAPGEYFIVFATDEEFGKLLANNGKYAAEQRREWVDGKIAGAAKATIKAKETEKIALTLP